MRREATKAHELRVAIDRLPLTTRRAMLEGIQRKSVIVGADGNPRGGVCPLYATASPPSKKVGRPFAQAWDRFAGARMPRPASERELRTLRSMLETSIGRETERRETEPVSLQAAIAAHKASQARSRAEDAARETRRPEPRADSGERDRSAELSRHEGWAWLRPFRRYDEYERALQALDGLAREAQAEVEAEVEAEDEAQRLLATSSPRG